MHFRPSSKETRIGGIFLVLLLASQPLHGEALRWAEVSSKATPSGFEIHAHNPRNVPVFVAVDISHPSNLRLTPGSEARRLLQPLESKRVVLAEAVDRSQPWDPAFEANACPGNPEREPDADVLYAIPYDSRKPRLVVSGPGSWPNHLGFSRWSYDFEMPIGEEVRAARGGIVVHTDRHFQLGGPAPWLADRANSVYVFHDDATLAMYLHLRYEGVTVSVGDRVEPGDLIGYSGSTGAAPEPHLHFSVYRARPDGNCESIPIRFDDGSGEGIELKEDMVLPRPRTDQVDAPREPRLFRPR